MTKQPHYIVKLNKRISDAFHMQREAFKESDINKFSLKIRIAEKEVDEAIRLRNEIKKSMRKYMTIQEFAQTFK